MADARDVERWLLNAEDAVGTSKAAQITWLREQRQTYAASADSGDWAMMSGSDAGGSASHARGISDKANHDAIVEALRTLGAIPPRTGGTVIRALFGNVQN